MFHWFESNTLRKFVICFFIGLRMENNNLLKQYVFRFLKENNINKKLRYHFIKYRGNHTIDNYRDIILVIDKSVRWSRTKEGYGFWCMHHTNLILACATMIDIIGKNKFIECLNYIERESVLLSLKYDKKFDCRNIKVFEKKFDEIVRLKKELYK